MGTYPRRLGAGWSYGGAPSYYEAAEVALREGFGEGVYNRDRNSGHGGERAAIAVGLAMARAFDDAVVYNAHPPRAMQLLAEWEDVLGLTPGPASWTVEYRWERLRARCLEAEGNHPDVLEVTFGLIVGGAVRAVEVWDDPLAYLPWVNCRFNMCVLVPKSAYDDRPRWDECLRAAVRVQPAHGRVTVAITHDGAPIATRLPEFRLSDTTSPDSLIGVDALGSAT